MEYVDYVRNEDGSIYTGCTLEEAQTYCSAFKGGRLPTMAEAFYFRAVEPPTFALKNYREWVQPEVDGYNVRGASFLGAGRLCAAHRDKFLSGFRLDNLGFRCMRDSVPRPKFDQMSLGV